MQQQVYQTAGTVYVVPHMTASVHATNQECCLCRGRRIVLGLTLSQLGSLPVAGMTPAGGWVRLWSTVAIEWHASYVRTDVLIKDGGRATREAFENIESKERQNSHFCQAQRYCYCVTFPSQATVYSCLVCSVRGIFVSVSPTSVGLFCVQVPVQLGVLDLERGSPYRRLACKQREGSLSSTTP